MSRMLVGYGDNKPEIQWPNRARIAINFIVNYEEGAELTPINGDKTARSMAVNFRLCKNLRVCAV
nr:hypothetical protein [Legionella sp.]